MLTITLPQLRKEIRLAQILANIRASLEEGNGEKFASPRALQRLKKGKLEKGQF